MLFCTADLHLDHGNIIKYCNRPFDSVEQMNEVLIDNWNNTVTAQDTVWVLGDFAMGKINESLKFVELLAGYKILVPGNHDRCWHGHKKTGDWTQRYLDAGFNEIQQVNQTDPLLIEAYRVHHFPYHGDSRAEERYMEHRPINYGHKLLHGHVHDAWSQKANMFNVGVDTNDFKPISIDEIKTRF